MRIEYYGYNSFVLDPERSPLFVDPGQSLYWRKMKSLIPARLWGNAKLVIVSHGDADHAKYARRISANSGAPIVCGTDLWREWKKADTIQPLAPGESIITGGVEILGLTTKHGPIISTRNGAITFKPPKVGIGSVGFHFRLNRRTFVNLGDTLFLSNEWKDLKPDLLMIPVGGTMTMNVEEAIAAIEEIKPKSIVPVHYDWHIIVYHRKTDLGKLEAAMEKMSIGYYNIPPGQQMEM
jgi:L-ascorbate metabolism protein UlaG (beta-lactamase superfamily)